MAKITDKMRLDFLRDSKTGVEYLNWRDSWVWSKFSTVKRKQTPRAAIDAALKSERGRRHAKK